MRVVGVVVLILFGILVLRLWTLQVIDAKSYAAAVTRNGVRVVSINAPRGEIVDRNDTVLVTNTPQEEILLSREEVAQEPSIVGKVAALVGETVKQVKTAVNNVRYSPYEPVPVATNVPAATVQYLETNQATYPGVTVQTVTQRAYPQGGSIATQVLGYVNNISSAYLKAHPNQGYSQGSIVGQAGIELQYEKYLRGVSGREALSVNAQGQVVGTVSKTAPQVGDTVVLNLDAGLQAYAENALAAQIAADRHTPDVDDHNQLPPAVNGAVIVMDPQNGQVLAMASSPTYDVADWVGGFPTAEYEALNAPCQATNDTTGCPFINYAIDGLYTPGSTFKLITATAALQDGLISPGYYFDDTGTFKIAGCPAPGVTDDTGCILHDNPGDASGEYNLSGALTVSSDSFFYNLGEMFWTDRGTYGDDPIQNEGHEYGDGEYTDIDLPGESLGRIDSLSVRDELHKEAPAVFGAGSWFTGDNIEMAFGQGETVLTPIEQADAYATFANGGTRYAPEVASAIVNPITGKVVKTIAPQVTGHVTISASTDNAILQGLEGVISNKNGTAYDDFEGFPASWHLAGKTGTASNETGREPNSWFVAFGPNPNPQYVVLAVIDQGGYGASAAAPLVRSIYNYLLANPVKPTATLPTLSTPPNLTAPTPNAPFGTPTTTTTTTTLPSGATTTTTTAPTAGSTTTTTSPAGG
jgi:penicillin-binding protein 2